MPTTIDSLFADLAETLGVEALPADDNGGVQLTVGDDTNVVLFAENELALMMVAPVMVLPAAIDYGRTLFLLRRNFYDSPLAPFRIGCDQAGGLIVWGRVPVEGLDGAGLAALVDALATEVATIREEVEVEG